MIPIARPPKATVKKDAQPKSTWVSVTVLQLWWFWLWLWFFIKWWFFFWCQATQELSESCPCISSFTKVLTCEDCCGAKYDDEDDGDDDDNGMMMTVMMIMMVMRMMMMGTCYVLPSLQILTSYYRAPAKASVKFLSRHQNISTMMNTDSSTIIQEHQSHFCQDHHHHHHHD